MSVVPTSDYGSVTEYSIFDQWGRVSLEAREKFGKDLRIHEQIKPRHGRLNTDDRYACAASAACLSSNEDETDL
jgi:hypothetical protein